MSHRAESVKRSIEVARREMDLGEAADLDFLRESFASVADAIVRLDDEGWEPINSVLASASGHKGLTIEDLQKLLKYTERNVKTNNLLGRGLRLKNNYIFGRGFQYVRKSGEAIQPRFQAIIDDPENQEVVFSETAVKELNRILYTGGNLLVIFNQKTRKFSRITVEPQLANYIAYDDDQSRVKYWCRTYQKRNDLSPGAAPEAVVEWIPVWQYAQTAGKRIPDSIDIGGGKKEPVNRDCVVIDLRVNRDDGETLGVPDCLAALPWAWAANEYLKDGSRLAKALAAIAYHVKAKTLAAATSAGAKIQKGRIGSAAITGPDTEIQSIPRAGGIDMYEGRPLQSAVALALDVSVAALTADTARGGSYASETALSQPEQLAALSRQKDFEDFFSRLFKAMGATDLAINFSRIDRDPIHRVIQSLGIARQLGGISQEEFRDVTLELLDVARLSTTLPAPDEFTGSKASTLKAYLDDQLSVQKDQSAQDAIASQGNSGVVGSLDDSGNSARQDDKAASGA